jgi:7-keto-8-aminopelargonate synthetase-like enzyme
MKVISDTILAIRTRGLGSLIEAADGQPFGLSDQVKGIRDAIFAPKARGAANIAVAPGDRSIVLSDPMKAVYEGLFALKSRGLGHLVSEDTQLDGRHVTLAGRRHVNFGSCSYVGLETDDRLKDAACDAIQKFGVQFASSRAYVSCTLYEELEDLLRRLFRSPIVIAQTTSLAHFAALPVLVGKDDAVLFDQFVHASVQAVLPTLRQAGVQCRPVRHNQMAKLNTLIADLAPKCRRVWYLADGVYSMGGDLCPTRELRELLNQHEKLHLYVDDAHGMSWTGRHGRGWMLDRELIHPRMVVALSLAKAFSASGAVMVFPDPEWAHLVRTCGSTMIFSGPLQPALLGAAIASAKIHLSDEIDDRQGALTERIDLFNSLCAKRGIRLGAISRTPIRFVKVGAENNTYVAAAELMKQGYFANVATFPAVPWRQSGLRIALTVHQRLDDIHGLVDRLAPMVAQA